MRFNACRVRLSGPRQISTSASLLRQVVVRQWSAGNCFRHFKWVPDVERSHYSKDSQIGYGFDQSGQFMELPLAA